LTGKKGKVKKKPKFIRGTIRIYQGMIPDPTFFYFLSNTREHQPDFSRELAASVSIKLQGNEPVSAVLVPGPHTCHSSSMARSTKIQAYIPRFNHEKNESLKNEGSK